MKKIYFLLVVLTLSGGLMAQYNVTFQVDMTGQTINTDGVHVAGDFQQAAGASGNWIPSATTMTQVGATNIYAVTVNIPAGNYQFKFINDNDWPGVEAVPAVSQVSLGKGFGSGNDNRWTTVLGDTTLAAVLFGGAAPAGMENITFLVDMSTQATVDDTVSVAGDFAVPNWSPGSQIMTDLFNDSLYRYTAYVTTGNTVSFKYINGTDWSLNESVPSGCSVGGNRQALVNNDTVAGPVCFSGCAACFIPDTFNVTIQIDMSAVCGFNDTVDMAGPFNGWPAGFDVNSMLTDANSDGIYEITLRVPAPEFEYKARFHANGNTNWEGGGNKIISFTKDTVVSVRCFGKDVYGPCAAKPAPSDITFRVDVSTFPNQADLNDVYLIADFTTPAWQTGKTLMTPVSGSPGVFEVTMPGICPGSIAYKFMNVKTDGTEQEEDFAGLQDSSCTEPSGTGSLNRVYTRPDDQPKVIGFKWNECTSIMGLEENFATTAIEIYPNPFSSFTTVRLDANEKYTINILDITGKEIRVLTDVSGDVTINKSDMAPGIYLMNIVNKEGRINSNKIIVQ